MNKVEIIIILLSIIALLSYGADRIKIPYPILLVLVGLGIGFIPGLPHVELEPEVVFLIFLPPLLYSSAWATSWHDFKAAKRSISMLAIGCVLFTTTAVAFASHWLIPEFTLAMGFVLGAIISPPDAVAATSVIKGLGIPRRIITVIEGESLVNDASGLIAYRYGVAAVMTGNFILWEASFQFILVVVAGILIGIVVGYVIAWVHHHTPDNPMVDTSVTFLTPFIAYLLAEHLKVSGVLAVVTSGIYLSWRSSEMFSHRTRIQAISVWGTVVFVLNGVVFILIGLQLPSILADIKSHSISTLIWYGTVISVVVIVVRIIWVFPGAYIPRWLSPKIRKNEPGVTWKLVSVTAWAGMRGVVSLAAALALPLDGKPFPHRNLILFITFCVILFTLVFQGLTLPLIIRWLGIMPDGNGQLEEIEARKQMASAAILHIEENFSLGVLTDEVLSQIKNKYEIRINHLNNYSAIGENEKEDIIYDQLYKVQNELISVERMLVIKMKKEGIIGDEVLRKLEFELDLEESKMSMENV